MSFILEALRKSEAARRRSETPDLFSAMHDAPAPARERRQAPVWIVGIVGVLSLGVATWLVLQRGPAPTAPAAPAAQAAGIGAQTAPASEAPAARPVTAPVTESPPVAQAIAASPPAPPAAASPPPPPAPAAVATRPAAAPAAAALPEPPPTPRPASDGRPMALSELDAGTRKQLPALRMSMHMWNEDAGRRFVILDGQRLGEGDLLGEAQVEAITRDGVILNWQGARLRLDTR